MKKIKNFAMEREVSPQAVYKHINKHQEELNGHINKSPDGMYLDDFACEFISQLMHRKTVVVADDHQDLKIKQLHEENEELHMQLDNYKNQIIDLQMKLLEASNLASQRLLLEKDKEVLENDNQRLKMVENELKEEIRSYKPIAFGLYRKKK